LPTCRNSAYAARAKIVSRAEKCMLVRLTEPSRPIRGLHATNVTRFWTVVGPLGRAKQRSIGAAMVRAMAPREPLTTKRTCTRFGARAVTARDGRRGQPIARTRRDAA
jgi:hypothetical protein